MQRIDIERAIRKHELWLQDPSLGSRAVFWRQEIQWLPEQACLDQAIFAFSALCLPRTHALSLKNTVIVESHIVQGTLVGEFESATLLRVFFIGVDLKYSSFSGALLDQVRFVGCHTSPNPLRDAETYNITVD